MPNVLLAQRSHTPSRPVPFRHVVDRRQQHVFVRQCRLTFRSVLRCCTCSIAWYTRATYVSSYVSTNMPRVARNKIAFKTFNQHYVVIVFFVKRGLYIFNIIVRAFHVFLLIKFIFKICF